MNLLKLAGRNTPHLSGKYLRLFAFTFLLATQGLSAQTKYVDITATGANNGSSWSDAYKQLSSALLAAQSDTSIHEILVAEGVYRPAVKGLDSSFGIFRGGLKLLGGYPKGGGDRDILQYPAVLDGNLSAGFSSRHVLVICGLAAGSDSVIVDGFVIQNGLANATGNASYNGNTLLRSAGGGIYVFNCNNGTKTVISNCQLRSNKANCVNGPFGGYLRGLGGGMFVKSSSPLVYNCIFSRNAGNRIKTMPSEPLSPVAYSLGTALCADDAAPAVVNCVFYGNTGGSSSIYSGYTAAAYPALSNCIVYGNDNSIAVSRGTLTAEYSIIQGGYAGAGNSSSDPLFVNAAANDFRLQDSSPAIDSGSNSALPAGSNFDYYGGVRILNTTVDRGVHEYGNLSVSGPNTLCACSSAGYPGSPAGGSYSHSNPAVASLGVSGLVTALSAGTDTLKYTLGTATVYKVIEVAAMPVVAPITGPESLCSGSGVILGNDTPGGIWSSSNGFIATISAAGLVTGLADGSVDVIYTVTRKGCSTSSVFPLTIHRSPVVSFDIPDILCTASILSIIATPAGGTFSHTNPAVIKVDKGEATGLSAGVDTFKYTVTDINGCTGSDVKVVMVPHPSPLPVITESGGVLTSTAGLSYLWFLNGVFIPSAVYQTYVPVTPGIYTVEVRLGDYNCPETSAPYSFSGLGIPSADIAAVARLYPNPANDQVHIEAAETGRVIIISTLDGRAVLQENSAKDLNIAALPEGLYLVTVYDKNGMLLLREKLLRQEP